MNDCDESPGVDYPPPKYRPYEECASRHVVYDTEVASPGSLGRQELLFFRRPMGMMDTSGTIAKTQAETNMMIGCQLPFPRRFTGGVLRLGMPLSVPFVDRMRAYCLGVLQLIFQHRYVWEGPLDVIPCSPMIEFTDGLQDCEAIFRPVGEDQQEKQGLVFGPRTLKQQETLQAKICWPSFSTKEGEPRPVLEGHVPISLYMFGELWEPRLER